MHKITAQTTNQTCFIPSYPIRCSAKLLCNKFPSPSTLVIIVSAAVLFPQALHTVVPAPFFSNDLAETPRSPQPAPHFRTGIGYLSRRHLLSTQSANRIQLHTDQLETSQPPQTCETYKYLRLDRCYSFLLSTCTRESQPRKAPTELSENSEINTARMISAILLIIITIFSMSNSQLS